MREPVNPFQMSGLTCQVPDSLTNNSVIYHSHVSSLPTDTQCIHILRCLGINVYLI